MKAMRVVMLLLAVTALTCGRNEVPSQGTARATGGRREVVLEEQALAASGIKVVPVTWEAFHPHVVASGVIRPDSQRSVTVRARVAGRVVRVLVDVGEQVRVGQPLAFIEGSEITAALARHRTAFAREAAARMAADRAARLLELKAMSRAELEARSAEAEAAAAEVAASREDLIRLGLAPDSPRAALTSPAEIAVSTPMAGVVLSRAVAPGLLVDKDASLFEVADLSRVWAVADVYEKDLGQLQENGEVEVNTDAYAGVVFMGRIALVEPALDEASRTAHVRVVLDNRSGKLRPGMFVTVSVPLRGAADAKAAAVPAEAVQKISGLRAVFVQTGPGRFELRPVEVGREAHGMVEIRNGLEEGESVVASGAFVLKSELLKASIEGEE
jgi:cobalt-zinc-cadmium efflux system membrane fusion protein